MQDLQGQWALVTGASSGFGVDFAHLLAQRGANVVLAARSVEPMEALAVELEAGYGVRAHVVGVDLARPGAGLDVSGWLNALTAWSIRFMPRMVQRRVAHALMKNQE
jgi:short-subunit dehydrogenase